jgi:ferritin-like protein
MINKELQELLKQYPDVMEIIVKAEGCKFDIIPEDFRIDDNKLIIFED